MSGGVVHDSGEVSSGSAVEGGSGSATGSSRVCRAVRPLQVGALWRCSRAGWRLAARTAPQTRLSVPTANSRRPYRILEHAFGGTATKILIVLERISGMIVIVGLLLGGLSCIVQFVGRPGDEVCNNAQASSSCFARLWRPQPRYFAQCTSQQLSLIVGHEPRALPAAAALGERSGLSEAGDTPQLQIGSAATCATPTS